MYLTFPAIWNFGENPDDGFGGPPVNDAGTIYIVREEDADDDWPNRDFTAPPIAGKTSIHELVLLTLDRWKGHDGFTSDQHAASSDALAAALRAAADALDAKRKRSDPRGKKLVEKYESLPKLPSGRLSKETMAIWDAYLDELGIGRHRAKQLMRAENK